jgi:hypothetical protein
MCVPISVATGGKTTGCLTGGNDAIIMAHIIALFALCGALLWNFRGLFGRGSVKVPADSKT